MMVFVFFLPNGFIGKLVAVQYSRADAKRKIEANRKEAC
jgi:hypothetical protein